MWLTKSSTKWWLRGPFPGPHPGARLEEASAQFHESLLRCGSVFQWPNYPQTEGQGPAYGWERNIMLTQGVTDKVQTEDVILNFNIWRILACLVQIVKFVIFCFSRFHSGARDTCVSLFVWRSLVGPHCWQWLDSLSMSFVTVPSHNLNGPRFLCTNWVSGSISLGPAQGNGVHPRWESPLSPWVVAESRGLRVREVWN